MDNKETFCKDGSINTRSDAWYDWKGVATRKMQIDEEQKDLLRQILEEAKDKENPEDWLNRG